MGKRGGFLNAPGSFAVLLWRNNARTEGGHGLKIQWFTLKVTHHSDLRASRVDPWMGTTHNHPLGFFRQFKGEGGEMCVETGVLHTINNS